MASSVLEGLRNTSKGRLSYSPKWDRSSDAERLVSFVREVTTMEEEWHSCLDTFSHQKCSRTLSPFL